MPESQLVADLKQTRRELEVRGRCKQTLIDTRGRVCLDGAVALATGIAIGEHGKGTIDLDSSPRAQAVLRALADHIPADRRISDGAHVRGKVYCFNDRLETTDEECFNLIDKALADKGGLAD